MPGVAVTVIRGHRIAWSEAHGVANNLGRTPLEPDSVFAVASNGKPVAAWLAVQLAARGELALDLPVAQQAGAGLPGTPGHGRITPRHLLAHTSGLGNFLRDRERRLQFEPGTAFAYSGVGFMVLQELIEARTGKPLEEVARRVLFTPLAMASSSFVAPVESPAPRSASHLELRNALAPFGLVAVPAMLVGAGVLVLGYRVARRRPPARAFLALLAAVALGAFAFLWARSDSATLALWFSLVPLALAAMFAAAVALAGRVAEGMPHRAALQAGVALAFVAAVAGLARASIPLPPLQPAPNAASSLRASAPDLARFLLELARPTLGSAAATHAMAEPQQSIDAVSAWGLGIGLETHAGGRELWHWGSNPGARSLMVIAPASGDGVVVLTNSGNGSQLMRAIAARAMGRQGCWRAGCAAP